jgi:hypothetical protein
MELGRPCNKDKRPTGYWFRGTQPMAFPSQGVTIFVPGAAGFEPPHSDRPETQGVRRLTRCKRGNHNNPDCIRRG